MNRMTSSRSLLIFIAVLTLILLAKLGFEYEYYGSTGWMGGDFYTYYRWGESLAKGLNPYDVKNLAKVTHNIPPLVYPGQFFFILPFTYLPWPIAPIFATVLSIASLFILFFSLTVALGREFFAKSNSLALKVALCAFFFSAPVQQTLYNGQISGIASCLLMLSMIASRTWVGSIYLGLTTAMKYSLSPLFIALMLSKGKVRLCLLALPIFLLLSLVPCFFSPNGFTLYTTYLSLVLQASWDYNSYVGGGGYDLVNFDFIKFSTINYLVKGAFVLLFLVGLRRENQREGLSLNFLFFTSAVSALLVYHRVHDLVLAVLFMVFIAIRVYEKREWVHFAILSGFFLLLAIPQRPLVIFAASLGQQIGENRWIYLGHFFQFSPSLPIPGIYTFLLTAYSAYFYFFKSDWLFNKKKLGSSLRDW